MASEEFKGFARVDVVVRLLVRTILPAVSAIIKAWHEKTSSKIGTCPAEGKQANKRCDHCLTWRQAIEDVLYIPPNGSVTSLHWNKVNLCLLHNSSLEVAKILALGNSVTPGINEYNDFDAASMLTIMMSFKEINRGDLTCYNLLRQIKDTHDTALQDLKLSQVELSLKELQKSVNDLIPILQKHQPKHFDSKMMTELETGISKVLCDLDFSPYMPVHAVLHLFAVHVRPHLINIFRGWYEKSKSHLQPCSTPSRCSSTTSYHRKELCSNCTSWIEVLEDVQNRREEKDSLSWKNVVFSNLYQDPAEVMKVLIPDMQLIESDVNNLDTKNTWIFMQNFTPFLVKDQKAAEAIKHIVDNFKNWFHIRLAESAYIAEATVDGFFKHVTILNASLHKLYPKYFTNQMKKELIAKLKEVRPLKIDGYDISIDDLEFGERINSGRFSRIKAIYTKPCGDKIQVAVQRLNAIDIDRIHLMKSLTHANIIQVVGICHKKSDTYLVTEYASKGDLRSYLDNRKDSPPPHLLKKWCKQACEAIEYLHCVKKCIHAEIQSTNFLIMDDDSLKLSNLQLVRDFEQTKSVSNHGPGSCQWMAPEIVTNQFRSMKSDIFALGVVMWEICTGKVPFGDIKGNFLQMDAVVKGQTHPIPSDCPKLKVLLDLCWKIKHLERPSIDELMKDVDEAILPFIEEQQNKHQASALVTATDTKAALTTLTQRPIKEVTIHVQYTKTEDPSLSGVNTTTNAILAFLNSGARGTIHLVSDEPEEMEESYKRFDCELHNMMEKRDQLRKYSIFNKDGRRYISIKQVEQKKVLAFSHAYKHEGTEIIEMFHPDELIDVSQSKASMMLPSLPEDICFKQSYPERGVSSGMIVFIDTGDDNFTASFNETSISKYVSAFANTYGGYILFGVDDNGIVSGALGTSDKQEITKTVTNMMGNIYWFNLEKGCIESQENEHWKIRFIDVIGTPQGVRRRVVVLTVQQFQNGHVYCQVPQCPILDATRKEHYRDMSLQEWCSYLQEIYLNTGKGSDTKASIMYETKEELHSSLQCTDDVGTLETDAAPADPSSSVTSASSLPVGRQQSASPLPPTGRPQPTSSLPPMRLQSHNISPAQRLQTSTRIQDTQTRVQDGCTVLPGSQSSLDESRSRHKQAVERYGKRYIEAKVPPADVHISFTNPPSSEGLTFSSGQTSGAVQKNTRIRGQRDRGNSDVAIWVPNFTETIHIVAYLVTEEGQQYLHPNRLVGPNCHDGIYSQYFDSCGQQIRLPGISINRVERNNIGTELDQRKAVIQKLCPHTTVQTTRSEEYDLTRVKLCIVGYIQDKDSNQYIVPLLPITSTTLFDRGYNIKKEPRIMKMTESKGPVNGGQEVKLVVKVQENDFDVLFTKNTTNPPSSWQVIAKVTETTRQKSTKLLTISTPSYYKKDITLSTSVKVQVRCNGMYSNTMAYTYMPQKDDSTDIRKKVKIKKPIFESHFMDVGAVCPDFLEYDDKESKMGMPKRKRLPKTRLTPQELATSENLMEVINRLPQVIPNRPLPKPKQKAVAAARPKQRPTDVSDGRESDSASEQLRKYKAFASTHGYKKTVKRVDDVKENFIQGYGAVAMLEEEKSNLPPVSEGGKQEYVSDWVSSTVPANQASNDEQANEDSEQKIAQEAEMKAIAQGEDHDSGSITGGGSDIDIVAEYQQQLEEEEEEEEEDASEGSRCNTPGGLADGPHKKVTFSESAVEDSDLVTKSINTEHVPENKEGKQTPMYQDSAKEQDAVLDNETITWGERLGKGKFGDVYLVQLEDGKDAAAIKSVNPNIVKIVKTLVKLTHPKVVDVYGVIWHKDQTYIIVEYMQCGSLMEMLAAGTVHSSRDSLSLVLQAAQGLAYLHTCKIAHGDVGVHNCFLRTGELKIRIIDLHEEKSYDSDVKKFGNLMVEILFNKPDDVNPSGATADPRPELPSHCPLKLKDIIESCLGEGMFSFQNMADVEKVLKRHVTKWLSVEEWTSLEDLDKYGKEIEDTNSRKVDHAKDLGIISIPGIDSGVGSSSVHSQYPMRALAGFLQSGDSTPESGTFETISPMSHSPGSTQQPHHLKLTLTSDYNSTISTQLLDREYEREITLAPAFADLKKDKQFSSLDTKPVRSESLPERMGFSLPLNITSTEPAVPSEPIINDKQNADVNKEKTGASAKRDVRKPKPPAVTKIVDASGGELVLEGLGISLTIQPGALQKPVEITVTVVYNAKTPHLEGQESNVCPVVRCLPTGLQFLKPAVIRIPHCVVPGKDGEMTAQVHSNHEEEDNDPIWQKTPSSTVDYPRTEIQGDHVLLSVLHFTDYFVTIEGVRMKKMKLASFVSEIFDEEDQEIRIYLFNDNPATLEHIRQDENEIQGVKKGPSPLYRIQPNKKHVTFQLSRPSVGWILVSETGTKTIDYNSVWHQDSVVSQFTLERKSNDVKKFRCKIEAWQDDNPQPPAQIEISNTIKRSNDLPRELQSLPPGSPQPANSYSQPSNSYYYQRQSTQMAVSGYSNGGSQSYQSSQRSDVLVGMPSASMPHNRSFDDSFNSISSSDCQVYCSGQMYTPVLPYELQRLVCEMLDGKNVLGNDWRRLAGAFQLDGHIDRLDSRCDSPTAKVLQCAQQQLKLENAKQLIDILQSIDRPDVAKVVQDNYYTQPVGYQQNGADALPYAQRPALDYPAHQSPPQAGMQGNLNQLTPRGGQPQVTSPPVASTPMRLSPDTPDTPGSGEAKVPPMTPLTSQSTGNQGRGCRRKIENTGDQSHISSSTGPSNVHPAEDDDTIAELQVDSAVSNRTTQSNQANNANYRIASEMDNNSNKVAASTGVPLSVENLAKQLQAASISTAAT